jgi:hypothetical protein
MNWENKKINFIGRKKQKLIKNIPLESSELLISQSLTLFESTRLKITN